MKKKEDVMVSDSVEEEEEEEEAHLQDFRVVLLHLILGLNDSMGYPDFILHLYSAHAPPCDI